MVAPMAGVPNPGMTPPPRYTDDAFTRFMTAVWTRPFWLAPVVVLACFVTGSALLLANDPTDGRPDPFGGCVFKAVTGFDCPGCGGTRALWYLVHANVPEAARHHAIALFAAPFLAYLYLAWAAQRLFKIQLPRLRITPGMFTGFLLVWGAYWILRNLPWAPFTWFYV